VSDANSKIPGPVAADRALVERCLAGEVAAWSEIYRQFHDSLLASIRGFLGKTGHDANLVDEVAARTWYAVIKNDYELLGKFDPRHGCRLSTFLSVLAKNETRVLFRSERRRRSREQQASRSELHTQPAAESPQEMSSDELLLTLTPAERTFYLDVLVAQPQDREQAEQGYTAQNLWQLRHRIRKKLERFILDNDS
jgi:DNA-directed RNA polymerase specialized sigma24 family protein